MKNFFETYEQQVLEIVRQIPIMEILPYLTNQYIMEIKDEMLRINVHAFLSSVYAGKYFIRCDGTLNTPEIIDRNELKIQFANLDENFIVTIGPGSITKQAVS